MITNLTNLIHSFQPTGAEMAYGVPMFCAALTALGFIKILGLVIDLA